MSSEKYIGLDVHQATISVAVMDSQGKIIMESILETKASTILDFFAGLRGTLSVTFEEGTSAAWLYDLLKPHVAKLLVCNPRRNALLKQGNKSDKMEARKLADRLGLNDLKPVYHGETGVRMLRELARSYLTLVKDLTRVMSRVKALYRSWAIPCSCRKIASLTTPLPVKYFFLSPVWDGLPFDAIVSYPAERSFVRSMLVLPDFR
jgi:Transposase